MNPFSSMRRARLTAGAAGLAFSVLAAPVCAQLGGTDHSSRPANLLEVWGITPAQLSKTYEVRQIDASVPANVLWPGDKTRLTFQVTNKTDKPIQASGRVEIIHYALTTPGADFFAYATKKLAIVGSVPVALNVPAGGFQNVTIAPPIPAKFGGYALIFDAPGQGRAFGAGVVRAVAQKPERIQYPTMSLDHRDPRFLERIGIRAIRLGVGYRPTTDKEFEKWFADFGREMKEYHDRNVTVLVMVMGGGPQPLGQMRSWLNDKGEGPMGYPGDLAWLPENDPDFTKFCRRVAAEYGWPKGPITGFHLWNEPWEGGSISGWAADMIRYRELYNAMFDGVNQARTQDGVDVLVGGCDSSSNALDKLFADGEDTFLPKFEFVSLHYQNLCSAFYVKKWRERKGGSGRVKLWDTESWAANTDEVILPRLAAWRAAGYDRLMGVDAALLSDEGEVEVRQADGKTIRRRAIHAYSPAASEGAVARFIGDRPFREILFKNGLPWVFSFGDAKNPDDGVLVIAGDVGSKNIFRSVKLRPGATITLPASPDYALLDYYGNPVPVRGGRVVIPLGTDGYYLRPSGKPGSFARLTRAVRAGEIVGVEPVQVVARDMTAPLAERPALTLRLTNVLNRPVTGALTAKLGTLTLNKPTQTLTLKPHETRIIDLIIIGGAAQESNQYPLTAIFDANSDGKVTHTETMRCNFLARRTVTVDGDLNDWKDVLPQTVTAAATPPSATEQAWYPYKTFSTSVKKGVATAFLAHDKDYFYFAAKIADDTPFAGAPRFETRNDDEFFYPEVAYKVDKNAGPNAQRETLRWPEGVRRYTYRKDPLLPAGNGQGLYDNVQIAFNVIPYDDVEAKGAYPYPPGTMPGYATHPDTDYEYALNPVGEKYGGGVEIWRLQTPGMPRKHFYPRQPKSKFDGPVKDGKLSFRREGNTRIVECAIPWSEIPIVKERLDAGKTIKFSFRVNDNDGPSYELAQSRSVSAPGGGITFHCDWVTHWKNELEFGAGK